MHKEELGKLYPITVVPYDVNWTTIFSPLIDLYNLVVPKDNLLRKITS